MDNLKKPIVAVVLGAAIAASLIVSRIDKKKDAECVIPKCDKSEKEVDCQKWVTGPGPMPGRFVWAGCNGILKDLAKGAACIPAPCVETNKPRELK